MADPLGYLANRPDFQSVGLEAGLNLTALAGIHGVPS